MIEQLNRVALALAFLVASSLPATATPVGCVGSCNEDLDVTVDEIVLMVNIALGQGSASQCQLGDADGSGDITVDEILQAITNALEGCQQVGGPLGVRRFVLNPQQSVLRAVLGPGLEFTLGTFQGQNDGAVGPAFFEFTAGEPDPVLGLASVDVSDASDYIFAEANIAGITFCLRPLVPATMAGVVDCDGGSDYSITTAVDHVVGRIGEEGFDFAACRAAGGRVEAPNRVCAEGLVGAECFLNSDCDSTTGSGDGLCGLTTGVCSGGGLLQTPSGCNTSEDCDEGESCVPAMCTEGMVGTTCRNAGDCDTKPAAEDGICGVDEAHPGACNGPLGFGQIGGDSGPGALIFAPLPEFGLQGLPVELNIESAPPCGDEGPAASQAFAMTSGLARTTIGNFSAGANDLVFNQEGVNFSCSNWSTGTGGRLVLAFPTLHLSPTDGGDLIIGFILQGQ